MRKIGKLAFAVLVTAVAMPAWALNEGTHLNSRGQSKVNKAMAQSYRQGGTEGVRKQQTQVNIGSKRDGTCTMNVGATPGTNPGSKETIVTAKEIINVCK